MSFIREKLRYQVDVCVSLCVQHMHVFVYAVSLQIYLTTSLYSSHVRP